MVVKAHSAPEVTIAFGTVYPVPLFTLGLETKVARTLASVVFSVVVTFETFYAEITSVEEGWHASDDVIVVIVMIQINLSGSLGSPVNDGIGVVPRTHYELIVRKYILKLFNLVSSALCQRHLSLSMQFFSERLLYLVGFANCIPLLVFVDSRFGRNYSSCATKLIFIHNLDYALLFL